MSHRFEDNAHVRMALPADAFSTGYYPREAVAKIEGNTFVIEMTAEAAVELYTQLGKLVSYYGLQAPTVRS